MFIRDSLIILTKEVAFPLHKMDIYRCSPIFVQNLLTTIEGGRRSKIRFGKHYKEALEQFKNFDYRNRSAIEKIQNEKFLSLLEYAYNNSPFYKSFYKDVDLSKIMSVKDIHLLPILDKETLRQNLESIYTIPEKGSYCSKTGGTTGKSLHFRHKVSDYQTRLAYLDAFKARHGFMHREMKRASFNRSTIVPPSQKSKIFWRYNKWMKQKLYSSHRCHGDNIKYYVEDLNKFKPHSIDGYPSSIYSVAKYINDNNVKLEFTPLAIFTTSETLYPNYRTEIEKAFGCKIYDQYSSSEGATFIFECEHGNLHIGEDTGIIEIGEDGEMLITSFFTHGTPLIRYKIGDKAIAGEDSFVCPCGLMLKTVKSLEGRTKDYILSKSHGKFTSVHLNTSIELLSTKVKGVQFVQNSVDFIDIYLEVEEGYDSKEDKLLRDELAYKIGSDMEFVFHHVSHLSKTENGKFKFIINNLENAEK